jgi:hypothetical protein
MMRARMTLVAALASAAVVLAGCGGGTNAGAGSSSLGAGAQVAPADTAAFVALDTDLNGGQWQAVDALLQKFPARDAIVAKLRGALESASHLSWTSDVQPALGSELDVAVVNAGGKAQAVVLLQPADQAKLDALVAKASSSGTKLLSEPVSGWTAIAESQAALDAVKNASSHLADSSVYQDATAKLAGDSLLHAYANGAEAKQLMGSLGTAVPVPSGSGQLVWAAADAVAKSGGLEVQGYLQTQGAATQPQPYAATLVHDIPAGALVVADFQAKGDGAAAAAPSGAASPFSALLAPLKQLAGALGGETAVYVSPGAPIPAVTLATHATDPQAVVDALDQALSGLGGATSGSGSGGLNLGSILGALKLQHEVVGDTLVVSTSAQAIADFKSGGAKLADDGTFQEATSAAAMPDRTNGFVYANLTDALPLVEGLAALGGGNLPSGLADNLKPLRTLTAYADSSNGVTSFTVFLEVQ